MKDFMFTLLAWLLTLPLIVAAVAFALYNQQNVAVVLNPFMPTFDLPLYVPVLAATGFGFLLGTMMTWAAMGRLRHDRRKQAERVKNLEKQLSNAKLTDIDMQTGYQRPRFLMIGKK